MKTESRIVILTAILLSLGIKANAADPDCLCMFVNPPKPSGVSVEIGSREHPDPPPLFVHVADHLIIKGTPDARLVCQTVDSGGHAIKTVVQLAARPPRQSVPCRAAVDPAGSGSSLPDFDKKRGKLDHDLLSFITITQTPLIWSPHLMLVRADNAHFQFNLPDTEGAYNLQIADDAGKKFDTTIKAEIPASGKAGAPLRLTPYRYEPASLEEGHRYHLSIAESGLPKFHDAADFAVISEQADERIKAEMAGIDTLEMGEHSKRLLRATIYGANDLYIDAISELTADKEAASDPEALRMLGDLYRLGKSYSSAATEYQASLRAPAMDNDSVAGQALSHESLGLVDEALRDDAAAITHYTEAQRLYESFHDAESANRMKEAVIRLKR